MKNNSCTIYLVRHAESHANILDIFGGDYKLTPTGKKQALKVGKKLMKIDFSAGFSSDLLRAKQTAELILSKKDLKIDVHKGLRERFFGSIENKKASEIRHLFETIGELSEKDFWERKVADGMESYQEAIDRFEKTLQEISKKHLGKNILIVSHGAVMRALLIKLGYGTFKELSPGSLGNTGYIKLKSDGVNFTIEEVYGVNKIYE